MRHLLNAPRALSAAVRRFAEDTRATITVETVLMLPLLTFWYVAGFVYFDVFRVNNINEKAAYTVADMLSRQTDPVDAAYIDGLNQVFDYLIQNEGQTRIRVTGVQYETDDDTYHAIWSYATRSGEAHNTERLALLRAGLPVMSDAEMVILVETFTDYSPVFNVGISDQTFRTFIVTRPRFAPLAQFISPTS